MSKAQEAEWSQVDWSKIQYKVTKLQTKIYAASKAGDKTTVVQYQKTLVQSYAARLLAVRRVTQDNKGKRIAGVDGKLCLEAHERLELVERLRLDGKTNSLRRVEIPKANGKITNLGIPTIEDRAKQALAKLALEPEWEAVFENNSYGFRPGRSCHDAIEAIELQIRRKAKYVLDADVSGCFDNINHDYLVKKCNTFREMEVQIRAWMKNGVMEGDIFHETESGTPQGGVISPLLANVALHGLESHITSKFPKVKTRVGMPKGEMKEICEARLIRYADKFVVIHENKDVIEEAKKEVENWLKAVGLRLNEEKIRISHTRDHIGDTEPGFDFLGFNIRTYEAGKYKSGVNSNHEPLMQVTKVRPSHKSVRKFIESIKDTLKRGHSTDPIKLVQNLEWIIRGWGNYFRTGSHAWETFNALEYQVLNKLYLNWGRKRFPKKGIGYISQKIFHKRGNYNYVFGWEKEGILYTVPLLHEFGYKKYVKIKEDRSPFDGDWIYWTKRRAEHPLCPKAIKRGIYEQKGLCYICGAPMGIEDELEVHHIDHNRKNNRKDNQAVVHRHCHDRDHGMTASKDVGGSLEPDRKSVV